MKVFTAAVDVQKSSIALVGSLTFLLVYLVIALLGVGLYLGSTFSLKYGTAAISNIEYIYRCTIYDEAEPFIRFLDAVDINAVKITCWSNSLSFFNRLLSSKYLTREAKRCLNGGSLLKVLEELYLAASSLFDNSVVWIANNPFLGTYPLYPTLSILSPISVEIRKFLNCECHLLDPVYQILLEPWRNQTIFCGVHQIVNGAIEFPQILGRYTVDIFLKVVTLAAQGRILDILKLFFADNPTNEFYYYLLRVPFERINSGLIYLGEWLDESFRIFVCTIVSEAKAGATSQAAVDFEYAQCKHTMDPIKIFCILSKIGVTLVRAVRILLEVILNIVKFLNPFDNFRFEKWNTDIVWDSIRVPLYDTSSLTQINYSGPITTCNATDEFTNTSISCTECQHISNTSLQECFCNDFVIKLDDLVDEAIGIRLFKPLLCDFLFGLLRLAVAIAKFIVDIIKTFPFQTVDLLSKYETYDRVLDEVAGPSYKFDSGIFYSPISLTLAIFPQYPSLKAIPSLVCYFLKSGIEFWRYITHLIANIFKDFQGTISPFAYGGFTNNYLCINRTSPYCIKLEDMFQWIRIPRNNSLLYNDFVPFNTTATNGFLEYICEIFNLGFLDSLNIPELTGFDIPDLCCFFYNFGRSVAEFIVFVAELVIVVIQTVFEFSINNPYNRILILEYLSCLDNSINAPCSNINSIINDISSIVQCGCFTIQDIKNIPGILGAIDTVPLDCLCNSITAIASFVSNALIEVRNTAQLVLGAFSCIDPSNGKFFNTPECTTVLPLKMVDLFGRVNTLFGLVGISFENLVCAFGSLLSYDCVNIQSSNCVVLDFDGCVRAQCNSFNPAEPIVTNVFPSASQFADCVNQCGDSCDACNASLASALNISGGSINCPNPCAALPCQPRDKLKVLAGKLWNLIEGYLKILTNLLSDIFLYGINKAGGNTPNPPSTFPFSLSDYVSLILTATGDGFFGDQSLNKWGIIQAFGDVLNCLIGPVDCSDVIYGDSSSAACFGNLFLIVGDLGRQIYPSVSLVITDIVTVIEYLITGNFKNIGNAIKNLIVDAFDLIFNQLLNNIGTALQALGSTIAAIISWAVTFGNPNAIYDTVNKIIQTLIKGVMTVLNTIERIFKFFKVKLKRTEFGLENIQNEFNLTDSDMEIIQNPELLLNTMTPDTWCYRVISEFSKKTNELSVLEDIAYRTCYNLAIFPIVSNANPDKVFTLPLDITYSGESIMASIETGVNTLDAYLKWNTANTHIYSLLDYSSPSQKRQVGGLINTIPYGSNFSKFLEDQNLIKPNNTNIIHQIIKYSETTQEEQKMQTSLDYGYKLQTYLNENPNHLEEYKKNGTLTRFTLYYSQYMALLKSQTSMKRTKKTVVSSQHVNFDHLFQCLSNTIKRSIPEFFARKTGFVQSQKRSVQGLEPNSLSLIFDNFYMERAKLVFDVLGYVAKKQFNTLTTKMDNHAQNLIQTIQITHQNKNRISLIDRVAIFHKKLKSIRSFTHLIPDLPQVIPNIGTTSLVNVSCNCDCDFVDNFLQQAVDIWTFCYETQVLGNNVSFVTYRGPLIELVPYNSSEGGNFVEKFFSSQFGFSITETLFAFFKQVNRKTYEGPVGLLYFLQPLNPFLTRPCERVHTTCELGVGLETALIYFLLGTVIYIFVIFAIFPPVANLFQILVIGAIYGGSFAVAAAYITSGAAWGYESKCFVQPENTLLQFTLNLATPPILPQCAIPEVTKIIKKYLITNTFLASFSSLGFLDILKNYTVEEYLQGVTCPNVVDLYSCDEIGITSLGSLIGITLIKYVPWLADWLRYSCLNRGGCLAQSFGTGTYLSEDGILASLFSGYNYTAVKNGDKVIEFCYWSNSWQLGIIILVLVVFYKILFDAIIFMIDVIKLFVVAIKTNIPVTNEESTLKVNTLLEPIN